MLSEQPREFTFKFVRLSKEKTHVKYKKRNIKMLLADHFFTINVFRNPLFI